VSSAKTLEFLDQAERYREAKEQTWDLATREILEQMERSCRVLARSQEQLERAKRQGEALDKRDPS